MRDAASLRPAKGKLVERAMSKRWSIALEHFHPPRRCGEVASAIETIRHLQIQTGESVMNVRPSSHAPEHGLNPGVLQHLNREVNKRRVQVVVRSGCGNPVDVGGRHCSIRLHCVNSQTTGTPRQTGYYLPSRHYYP